MCVILDSMRLFNTHTLQIGVMFLQPHECITYFVESNLFSTFKVVISSILSVLHVIPRAVKTFTQSKLFSLKNLLCVSLIGPILMTFVLD